MPGKLFFLEDRRSHLVTDPQYQEISVLPVEYGPLLVVAKGTIRGVNVEFNVGIDLRLELHAMFSGLVGFDETEFFNEPANIGAGGTLISSGSADHDTFMLTLAATLPAEGGAGSKGAPVPPPHRAVLLAKKNTASGGTAALTNVKIFAIPMDEIVATVLT